jgi:hypothetical protein
LEPRRTPTGADRWTLKRGPRLWEFPAPRCRIRIPGMPRGRENGEAEPVNRICGDEDLEYSEGQVNLMRVAGEGVHTPPVHPIRFQMPWRGTPGLL